jgi:hypothetical protein
MMSNDYKDNFRLETYANIAANTLDGSTIRWVSERARAVIRRRAVRALTAGSKVVKGHGVSAERTQYELKSLYTSP